MQDLLNGAPIVQRGLPAARRDGTSDPAFARVGSAARTTLGAPGARFEREAENTAQRVANPDRGAHAQDNAEQQAIAPDRTSNRAPNPASMAAVTPSVVGDPLAQRAAAGTAGGGRPLDPATRGRFESRLGHPLDDVRVHVDARAAQAAQTLNANAYAWGSHIVFDRDRYRPETRDGERLLAHELTHVVQQRETGAPAVQRDLKAYNEEKSETLGGFNAMGGGFSSSYMTSTAEAPGLRAALKDLIDAGKVKEVVSTDGKVSWFAAEHHKDAQLSEIEQALQTAGYAKATKLAKAIYDIHGEFLYTKDTMTTIAPFYSHTSTIGEKVRTVTNRSMTEWEIRQAKRVFGSALDYAAVTIADGSISAKVASAGGYARTIRNVINFPTGSSRSMSFMIHELTHVWQYQKTGISYIAKALWAQMTEGYSYADDGKTPEDSLKDARTAGKTLYSYNLEQQGDILSDYYRRLQKGEDTTAWDPFVADVK
ncbi:MAG: DUF4157 domain-containing protein [Lysobacter sp.]|nr:DUF4157 domain-containing protein [Lysobacter sp.]